MIFLYFIFVIQEIHTNQKLPLDGAKGSKTQQFTLPETLNEKSNAKHHMSLLKWIISEVGMAKGLG